MIGKLKSARINGSDLVPVVRVADSKPGMYDLTRRVFLTNAAAGGSEFTWG